MIGSQAIQQLILKQEHAEFLRKTDGRIAVLREVIERLGRGEDVNVERMLGTGVEAEEKSWDEGMCPVIHSRTMEEVLTAPVCLQ